MGNGHERNRTLKKQLENSEKLNENRHKIDVALVRDN